MIKISIIILTFNQKDLTKRCLDAVYPIIRNKEAEIILIDNGSTDGTEGYLKKNFPKIKFIRNQKNEGVAKGRNIGLKEAIGEVCVLLDNDTIASPETIWEMYEFLEKNKDYGLIAPRLINQKNQTQKSFKEFPSITEKFKHWISSSRKDDFIEVSTTEIIEPYYVIGATQMFRRELLRTIGYLDENIFFGPEDADFCNRIRSAGKKIGYLPFLTVIHDWQRSTTGKLFSYRSFLHIKGLIYFYWKNKRIF